MEGFGWWRDGVWLVSGALVVWKNEFGWGGGWWVVGGLQGQVVGCVLGG